MLSGKKAEHKIFTFEKNYELKISGRKFRSLWMGAFVKFFIKDFYNKYVNFKKI